MMRTATILRGAVAALLLVPCLAAAPTGPEAGDAQRAKELQGVMEKLRPLHARMGKPEPGDWLSQHREAGQTFQEYLDGNPTLPRGERTVIYIQPIGDFTPEQRKIVDLTAAFMSLYFNLAVQTQPDLPLKLIPASARRVHPQWGVKQILTTYILDEVLQPKLPKDAAACIGFTASDLWPGEGWNFVFGQASLSERVGVWSIARNGDPAKDADSFRLCLLRTLKTATHETGHMFSLLHCTLYECNMCGSNHREEADRRPIALCPECLAKVCWATRTDPVERFKKLAAFCRENGLKPEQEFCERSIRALQGP